MEVGSDIRTLYRLLFLYLEPFLAIGKAMQTHFAPSMILRSYSSSFSSWSRALANRQPCEKEVGLV